MDGGTHIGDDRIWSNNYNQSLATITITHKISNYYGKVEEMYTNTQKRTKINEMRMYEGLM